LPWYFAPDGLKKVVIPAQAGIHVDLLEEWRKREIKMD
jgi:hypothetical protein